MRLFKTTLIMIINIYLHLKALMIFLQFITLITCKRRSSRY